MSQSIALYRYPALQQSVTGNKHHSRTLVSILDRYNDRSQLTWDCNFHLAIVSGNNIIGYNFTK